MKKIDLGLENDLSVHSPYSLNYATEFNLQAFAEEGKAVFIFSETPQNYTDPELRRLDAYMTGAVGETLSELGLKSVSNVEVIYHRPENVTGNNPESFEKINYYYDLNGLHQHYRNGREELTADQVAGKIGPENFVEKQFAQEPTIKEEVSQQQDYSKAHLASLQVADNDVSVQQLRDLANDIGPDR